MGVDERSRSRPSSLLPNSMPGPAPGSRLHRAMQIAQQKYRMLRGSGKKLQEVESSITFHEAEREVGSAAWCALLHSGAELTPTQQAARAWVGRNKSIGKGKDSMERCESASATSAAETVRDEARERIPESSVIHAVTKIDTMMGICLKYDISVEELLAINKPASRALLLARKTIMIPVFADEDAEKREDDLLESCQAGRAHGGDAEAGEGDLRFEVPRECGVCNATAASRDGKGGGGRGCAQSRDCAQDAEDAPPPASLSAASTFCLPGPSAHPPAAFSASVGAPVPHPASTNTRLPSF